MNLRSEGSVQAAKILQEITTKSPTRAAKYQAALKRVSTFTPAEISGDLALATVINGNITKNACQEIRNI